MRVRRSRDAIVLQMVQCRSDAAQIEAGYVQSAVYYKSCYFLANAPVSHFARRSVAAGWPRNPRNQAVRFEGVRTNLSAPCFEFG